mmetsp:Transcript_141026/g.316212  ORF Transcript_141026/g.316212 Transcript_141026/m.316212 type:complete len:210 (-) Transcript_141026:53-682(-)
MLTLTPPWPPGLCRGPRRSATATSPTRTRPSVCLMVNFAMLPTFRDSTCSMSSSTFLTRPPFTAMISSPRTSVLRACPEILNGSSPSLAAGPSGSTPTTPAPSSPARVPTCVGRHVTPRYACRVRPWRIICPTTRLTVSAGTAKPTPAKAPEGEAIIVATPTTSPREFSSGPPELPGLMAASVWTTPRMRPAIPCTSRPKPLTMPAVSV